MSEQVGKPWYRSATIYALAVAIIAKLAMVFGDFGEDAANVLAVELTTHLLAAIAIGADLVAVWGRKRATGPLTAAPASKEDDNETENDV